jgi:hypothetical protein
MDPNAVFTAAASTAGAIMTEMAQVTPSPAPVTETATLTPEAATATLEPTTGVISATATTAATGGATVAPGADNSEYVRDVSVPDGTDYAPNATFEKTWEIKNNGSTTWTTDYELVWVDGNQMDGPASVPVPQEVAPNASVELSVDLVAPETPGQYTGYWRLRNAQDTFFGTVVYVQIDVVGAGTAIASGSTPTPTTAGTTPGAATSTATTAPSTSAAVSALSISVDRATASGACPYTFTFTAQFTLDKPSPVTYQLDAVADQANFTIDAPDAVTTNLGAGAHTLTYTLQFQNTVSGTARLHITSPEDVTSAPVNFSLTCE